MMNVSALTYNTCLYKSTSNAFHLVTKFKHKKKHLILVSMWQVNRKYHFSLEMLSSQLSLKLPYDVADGRCYEHIHQEQARSASSQRLA